MEIHDFIVVGSGCTGSMAAQTLAEAGKKFLLLDGGITDDHYQNLQPQKDFVDLRETDAQQHRYLLGDQFESLPADELGTGAQLTPARSFLIRDVEKFLPLFSPDFSPMESLALGGLGGGWGLGCCVFSDAELEKCGLSKEKMKAAYQVVADRIGISAAKDDATPFTANGLHNTQPAPKADEVAQTLLRKYESKKSSLNKNGFYLGRPALALLTEKKEERQPLAYRDMDFYDDLEKAAWRPAFTIEKLKKQPNVNYRGGLLVTDFFEEEDFVRVEAVRLDNREKETFFCRRLILSPGVLGTARIVLRSMSGGEKTKLPLLCNPYTYMPCLVPSRLGKPVAEKNFGFAQLSLFHDANGRQEDIAMASLYTYRSLMLFRLVRETPLNFRDGRIFMQHVAPALLVAGIHHPETRQEGRQLFLEKDPQSPTGDRLHVNYPSHGSIAAREKKYAAALRKLGAWSLKKVRPKIGASIHYAGVLPFSGTEKSFALHPSGKLHGTNRVYVADGSGFSFLPAKGLTLSLMANAHVVAEEAMR